jgi:hypothetical protein
MREIHTLRFGGLLFVPDWTPSQTPRALGLKSAAGGDMRLDG